MPDKVYVWCVQSLHTMFLVPGSIELVRACREAGLRVAVASSADRVKVSLACWSACYSATLCNSATPCTILTLQELLGASAAYVLVCSGARFCTMRAVPTRAALDNSCLVSQVYAARVGK